MNKISQIQTPFIQNQSIPNLKPEKKIEGFGEMFKKALQDVNAAHKRNRGN